MKRMWMSDLMVCSQYLKQMVWVAVVITLCLTAGMGTAVAGAGIMVFWALFGFTMSVGSYDDACGWGFYRLTLPVSRRDVVAGRYAAVLTVGLCALLLGLGACAVFSGIATVVPLPFGLSEKFVLATENDVLATVFSGFFCFSAASLMTAIMLPCLFKWGATKTVQRLPLVFIVLFIGGMLALGGLDDATIGALRDALSWMQTPEGVAATSAAAVATVLVLLAVSMVVSVRVYDRRDL